MNITNNQKKTIVISGGFDPIHPGHIAMIESAAEYGEVHIIVNSDDWLIRKKGFFFQPFADRKKILEAYTPYVYDVGDADGTVCEALRRIKPDYFGNGGDRTNKNTPELDICKELGIEPVFGLGGGKYSSSSVINGKQRVVSDWGTSDTLLSMPKLNVTLLSIKAGKKISSEEQSKSAKYYFKTNGEVYINLAGETHLPEASKAEDMVILEVKVGN